MREIELSSMISAGALGLDSFEERTFIHVRHRPLDWESGWNQILQIALYQKGPDVSEVGSTWLENLDSMRAIRPFSLQESLSLGEKDCLPTVWSSFDQVSARERISIPWTLDTRLVHYRRDLLALAGIAEDGAFATPEAFYDTLARLRAAGFAYPFVMATGGLSVHNLACWVWGRGGHFRSADNHKLTLVEPQSLQGMVDYFNLHQFIDPQTCSFDYAQADNWFLAGHAPVLFSGQWVTRLADYGHFLPKPEVAENLWHAEPPGIPYVGSTHLVIWKHSLHEAEALELIRHLTGSQVSPSILISQGVYPPRAALLNAPPFDADPRSQVIINCLRKGRNFRAKRLWAGVEMRLTDLVDKLWVDIFTHPELDIAAEVKRRVTELADRLERTLLAN